jgi:hypothetical protein
VVFLCNKSLRRALLQWFLCTKLLRPDENFTVLLHLQWFFCAESGSEEHSGSERKVVPRGLEPRTFRLLAERSNQLSYETDEMRLMTQNVTLRWSNA